LRRGRTIPFGRGAGLFRGFNPEIRTTGPTFSARRTGALLPIIPGHTMHQRRDPMKARITALALLAAALQLTACGGGSSSSSSSGGAPAVAAKGIATPKSVSVVTAN
jgi:hypothetical protein